MIKFINTEMKSMLYFYYYVVQLMCFLRADSGSDKSVPSSKNEVKQKK